jgi:hypothetical protein
MLWSISGACHQQRHLCFIHIFKGPKEAFGAFFLGILLCLITYYTNSIWMALIIHIAMAVINDIKAVNATKKSEKASENI